MGKSFFFVGALKTGKKLFKKKKEKFDPEELKQKESFLIEKFI